ncbi:MAG: pentapeptide repeat-containing protein [Crocosphaera sp.]
MTPEEINSCLVSNSSMSVSWLLHRVYWISCYRDSLLILINASNFIFVGLIGLILTRYFTKRRNEYESFQSYLSNIKDILTKESISDNNQQQIKLIIKALTEEVIYAVNEERVKKVFNFLADASLIQKKGYPGIKRLTISQVLKSIELKNIDLINIEKLRGVDFSNAKLSNISFQKSDLTGAKFDNADLVNVDFREAIVKNVSFKGATIDDIKYLSKRNWLENKLIKDADITGIKIQNAKFYTVPTISNNIGSCFLGGYELEGMNFLKVIFENGQFLHTTLKETRWEKSNLKGTDFIISDLSHSDFIESNLEYTNFNCPLDNVEFIKCKINKCHFYPIISFFQNIAFDKSRFLQIISSPQHLIFYQSRLEKVTFKAERFRQYQTMNFKLFGFIVKLAFISKAPIVSPNIIFNLSGSIFKDCRLIETTFDRTILKKVDFTNSRIINSNFQGANLVDADLSKTIIDDKTSFKNALYSENTKFPQDFSPIEHEMKKVA